MKKAVAAVEKASTFRKLVFLVVVLLSPGTGSIEASGSEKERLTFLRSVARGHSQLGDFKWSKSWSCGSEYCGGLTSCEHAFHALLVCNSSERDGDSDGVPCESLCKVVDGDPPK